MGRYFNKGRGSLPLTLNGGKSVSVPGNSWIVLEGRDETTASVRRAVKKGQLFQQRAKKQLAAPTKSETTEVKTTATPAGEEAPADTAAEESKPTEAASKKARRSRARATAE